MALTAWRLVKAKYAASAFDGEGARRFGGRWNEPGTALVYLGGSLALAALEVFVHLSARDTRLRFVAIPVTIPDSVVIERLALNELPRHWRQEPPPDATKQLGTMTEGTSNTAARVALAQRVGADGVQQLLI